MDNDNTNIVEALNNQIRALEIARDFIKQFNKAVDPAILADALAQVQTLLRQQGQQGSMTSGSLSRTEDANIADADSVANTSHEVPHVTRKQQAINFLKEHGSATWTELETHAGIPRGSINSILRDKDTFVKDERGRYALRVP